MAKSKSQDKKKGLPALEKSPSHLLHRALQLALDIYADEQGDGGVTQRQSGWRQVRNVAQANVSSRQVYVVGAPSNGLYRRSGGGLRQRDVRAGGVSQVS